MQQGRKALFYESALFFKGEIYSTYNTDKAQQITQFKCLFQVKDSKNRENNQRNYFLNDFKLKACPPPSKAQAISRNHQAILKKSNSPANQDSFP